MNGPEVSYVIKETTKQSGAPGHADVVGSVNTITWVGQHNKAKTLRMEHVKGREFTEKKEED